MLEVCVDSCEDALLAVDAGAQRIELSEQLDIGGITPRSELIDAVRKAIDVPLVVLVRCRGGDFIFDRLEQQRMLEEASHAIALGADGIAVGGLNPKNDLDLDFLRSFEGLALTGELVMHRAFDFVHDPEKSLEELVQLGFSRILTSGGPPFAIDGTSELQQLNSWATQRIEILPAGGINGTNAARILSTTGCRQLHGSMKNPQTKRPCADTIRSVRETLRQWNCT